MNESQVPQLGLLSGLQVDRRRKKPLSSGFLIGAPRFELGNL
jgi:hypothetical protein